MHCRECGAQVSAGDKFCTNCGTDVIIPTRPPSAPRKVEVPKKSWSETFREGWRNFVKSPLVLCAVVCYTIVQIINLMAIDEATNSVYAIMDSLDSEAGVVFGKIGSLSETMQFISVLPGLLMAIGLWITYIDAYSYSSSPIKTSGLSVILGVQVINIGVLVVTLFSVFSALDTLKAELGELLPDEFLQAISTVKGITALIVIISCAIYGFIGYAVSRIKHAADECDPEDSSVAYGLGILSVLSGAISLITSLFNEMNFVGLASGVATMLIGVVLCQYRDAMGELEYYFKNDKTSGGSSTTVGPDESKNQAKSSSATEYIPAWKRVQLAEAACSAGEKNTVIREEKAPSPAKKCPECGTVQSGDNRVCYYCNEDLTVKS